LLFYRRISFKNPIIPTLIITISMLATLSIVLPLMQDAMSSTLNSNLTNTTNDEALSIKVAHPVALVVPPGESEDRYYTFEFLADNEGKPLNGNSSYLIHFDKGKTPPTPGIWYILMYKNKSLFFDNPIRRDAIGVFTQGQENNTDGSLDIYIQNASPGKGKEANWLPAPEGAFNMILRSYLPQPQILNGTWQPPLVQRVR
jgi:hypothetical protein